MPCEKLAQRERERAGQSVAVAHSDHTFVEMYFQRKQRDRGRVKHRERECCGR